MMWGEVLALVGGDVKEMWIPFPPDLPQEVLFGFSLTLMTSAILWLIVSDSRRVRRTGHRAHEWLLLGFILIINAAIVSVIVFYRRELVSILSSARTVATEPAVLLTFLITISYIIYAIYKREPKLTRS